MNHRYCVRIDKVRMCRTDKETEKKKLECAELLKKRLSYKYFTLV